jgi:hypothetical protein
MIFCVFNTETLRGEDGSDAPAPSIKQLCVVRPSPRGTTGDWSLSLSLRRRRARHGRAKVSDAQRWISVNSDSAHGSRLGLGFTDGDTDKIRRVRTQGSNASGRQVRRGGQTGRGRTAHARTIVRCSDPF